MAAARARAGVHTITRAGTLIGGQERVDQVDPPDRDETGERKEPHKSGWYCDAQSSTLGVERTRTPVRERNGPSCFPSWIAAPRGPEREYARLKVGDEFGPSRSGQCVHGRTGSPVAAIRETQFVGLRPRATKPSCDVKCTAALRATSLSGSLPTREPGSTRGRTQRQLRKNRTLAADTAPEDTLVCAARASEHRGRPFRPTIRRPEHREQRENTTATRPIRRGQTSRRRCSVYHLECLEG
jgi:hypothetical protein